MLCACGYIQYANHLTRHCCPPDSDDAAAGSAAQHLRNAADDPHQPARDAASDRSVTRSDLILAWADLTPALALIPT